MWPCLSFFIWKIGSKKGVITPEWREKNGIILARL
jgi:hypothetical protein